MDCSDLRTYFGRLLRPIAAVVLFVPAAGLPHVLAGEREHRDSMVVNNLASIGLHDLEAFHLLQRLTSAAPHRLSGSHGAERAIALTKSMMQTLGFQNVRLEPVTVPHWERGNVERAEVLGSANLKPHRLSAAALGGSVPTPHTGVTAEVIEVHSFEELSRVNAEGKIVFFDWPMDPSHVNTFEAYEEAVAERVRSAEQAGKAGAVAALVRSLTLRDDDTPHVGAMRYGTDIRKIPAAALGARSASWLSEALKQHPHLRLRLVLSCRTLPDVPSANVIGEIRGSEHPEQVIVVSGHLDCWDKGQGAHDDGAGCVQALEALRLLSKAGLVPRRTVRAVLFINEENGARGGKAYAAASERSGETPVAVLESDAGGFAPRGFRVQADSPAVAAIARWKDLLGILEADVLEKGGSATDISAMASRGVPALSLVTESQRYFDYHHSDKDTIDKVNPRELELGAITEAVMCYLLSERGL